jgi:ferredoxin-NADP reductase
MADRRTFELPFLERQVETPSVSTFRFSTKGSGFSYRSNQAVRLQLPDLVDPWGPARLLSLSSSPTETGRIAVTTKLTGSPFKEKLNRLRPGETVQVHGPLGHLFFDPERPALMIAGGIGVTPLRGMIRFAADRGLREPITLLYSARTPEELAFRAELDRLGSQHSELRTKYTVTRPTESARELWTGRVGRIDAAWVQEAARPLDRPKYYVVGLPEFLTEQLRILSTVLHAPRDDVVFEPFHGF